MGNLSWIGLNSGCGWGCSAFACIVLSTSIYMSPVLHGLCFSSLAGYMQGGDNDTDDDYLPVHARFREFEVKIKA